MSHDSHMTTDTQHVDGQPVQLEDGTTAFLHHTPKGKNKHAFLLHVNTPIPAENP